MFFEGILIWSFWHCCAVMLAFFKASNQRQELFGKAVSRRVREVSDEASRAVSNLGYVGGVTAS